MDAASKIVEAALGLGFARVGFCSAEPFIEGRERLERWLEAGMHGTMTYLAGDDRADPRALLSEAKTLIVVALAYPLSPVSLRASRNGAPLNGEVAGYARGGDYHRVMKDKLRVLADACAVVVGRPVASRACVDTAPLLEREAAARAGLGFVGKSTLLVAPGAGTSFLLGELLVDVELAPSAPVSPGCGSCTACLDICPTGAFVSAQVLDARRCISYLTIEYRGVIPRELREPIGMRVFGCDACQTACPFNASDRARPADPELSGRVGSEGLDLIELLGMGNGAYRRLVRKTAIRRASRNVLARNAAIALGNARDERAVPALCRALSTHPSAVVRVHAAWALGRIGSTEAGAALQAAAVEDRDPRVRDEAKDALELDGPRDSA